MADKFKKKNIAGGLTGRWIVQTATVTVAILLIICVLTAYFIHSYYYTTAERKIVSYASGINDSYFELH